MTLESYATPALGPPHQVVGAGAADCPPYHYDTHVGIQELQNDWRLSDDEIQTLVGPGWTPGPPERGIPGTLPQTPGGAPPGRWGVPEWQRSSARPDPGDPGPIPTRVPRHGARTLVAPPEPQRAITQEPVHQGHPKREALRGGAGRWRTTRNSTFVPGSSTAEADIVGGGGPGSVRLSEYALGKIGEVGSPSDACRIAPAGANVRWDIHYYPNGTEVVDGPDGGGALVPRTRRWTPQDTLTANAGALLPSRAAPGISRSNPTAPS